MMSSEFVFAAVTCVKRILNVALGCGRESQMMISTENEQHDDKATFPNNYG